MVLLVHDWDGLTGYEMKRADMLADLGYAVFANLGMELEKHGVAHEMISYGGAPHAFTVFGSERYRKDTDEKSWKRIWKKRRCILRHS